VSHAAGSGTEPSRQSSPKAGRTGCRLLAERRQCAPSDAHLHREEESTARVRQRAPQKDPEPRRTRRLGLAAPGTVDAPLWAGAKGFRLGIERRDSERFPLARRPYTSLSSSPRNWDERKATDRTLGRAWRIVGNSPSQCLCHSRNGATGSTFAHVAEAAGPPHVDSHPRAAKVQEGLGRPLFTTFCTPGLEGAQR
jgi:hypothetical protein